MMKIINNVEITTMAEYQVLAKHAADSKKPGKSDNVTFTFTAAQVAAIVMNEDNSVRAGGMHIMYFKDDDYVAISMYNTALGYSQVYAMTEAEYDVFHADVCNAHAKINAIKTLLS